jgi:hypothetical protein
VYHVDLTHSQLYDILWGAVRRLLEINIHVVCFVSDGASFNRKFYMDHPSEEGKQGTVTYKARNIYEPERYVYSFHA